MRIRPSLHGALVAALLAACDGSGEDRPSSFTSAALPGTGSRSLAPGEASAGAPAATPRAVEEADIVKTDGAGHLYALSPYRGLQILDVRDPDAPRLLGRAPILGQPVEMYVADGLAYVVVSDTYAWGWKAASGALTTSRGSEIQVIDVSVPAAPRPLATFALEGFASQTRRVGDVIYAVSTLPSWLAGGDAAADLTFVAAIDVADPADIRVVDRVDFDGSAYQIHATADTLFVAQPRWDGGGVGPATGTTRVQVVDISDPHGQMVLGGSADVPGYLDSRLQLDARGDVLRILTHDGGWGPTGGQRLATYRVAGRQLVALGALDLPQSGGLFGVRFDGDRAYFATFVTTDPLEIVDLGDPARPALVGSLEVDGTLYQLVPRGDRLIALGTADGTWRGVEVSLYDVGDAARPALLARAPVGAESAWSQAFWDDKAFAIVDELGLVAVPFQAWDRTSTQPTQGLQLVSLARDGVRARGRIAQAGTIERALPLGRRVGTLSDLSFATCDIDDMDAPQPLGTIELVRNVVDMAPAGGGFALLLAPADYWRDDQGLRLRTVTAAHVDDGELIAELALPDGAGRLIPDGDLLYVVTQTWDRTAARPIVRVHVVAASDLAHPRLRGSVTVPLADGDWPSWTWGLGASDEGIVLAGKVLVFLAQHAASGPGGAWSVSQQLWAVDLRNPDAPRVAPPLDLGVDWATGLIALDARVYATHAEVVATAPDQTVVVRDYMDRIDVSDPARPRRLSSVNIPGLLVAVLDAGARIVTVDYQWSSANPTNRLVALTVMGDRALLDGALDVPAQIGRVRLGGDLAYFTTQPWYWAASSTAATTLHVVDVAAMRELATRSLEGTYSLRELQAGKLFLETGGFWWWWRGGVVPASAVAPCYLGGCMGSGADAIAVFDLADPAAPAFVGATRLNGWILHVVVSGAKAYLPSGWYGVQTVAL